MENTQNLTKKHKFLIVTTILAIIFSAFYLFMCLMNIATSNIFWSFIIGAAITITALVLSIIILVKTIKKPENYPLVLVLLNTLLLLFIVITPFYYIYFESVVNGFAPGNVGAIILIQGCIPFFVAILYIIDMIRFKSQAVKNNNQLTQKRPFLLVAAILNLVAAAISCVIVIYYFVICIIYQDALISELGKQAYQNYVAEFLVLFMYVVISIALSILLIKNYNKPVLEYPLGLVVTNLILCSTSLIPFVLIIVDIVQQSRIKKRVNSGETWLNSEQETIEHDKNVQVQTSKSVPVQEASKDDLLLKKLTQLQKMKEAGLITDDEFKALKAKLIDNM